MTPFATLRRLAAPPDRRERCELCRAGLTPVHRHLLEMVGHRIVCACDPCALRFHDVVGGRFKLIPRDPRPLPDFRVSDAAWEALSLPIELVFIVRNSSEDRMAAYYPSPAGATESLLPLAAWNRVEEENPALGQMEADVEALLIDGRSASRKGFVAPIDACFELVGLIRSHWRGLSGGEAASHAIDGFFAELRRKAGLPVDAIPQHAGD